MRQALFTGGYLLLSSALVFLFPRSLLAFLVLQSSLLLLYYVSLPKTLRWFYTIVLLCLVLPAAGIVNGYYMEVATQVGIFVALALGLNIVVGMAGLLDLGYVAFFAVGAYAWAIFGSSQANRFIP